MNIVNNSDFYANFIGDDSAINFFRAVLKEATGLVEDLYKQVGNNAIVSKTELYRTIPYFKLIAQTGLYDIIYIKGKHPDWDSKTLKEQIDILTELGYYETLEFIRPWETKSKAIISLEIDHSVSGIIDQPYVNFLDYVIYNNKLFFFRSLATLPDNFSTLKTIHLKNIQVAHNKLTNKWGDILELLESSQVTKYEYRDILTAALQCYMGGPTLYNMTKVVKVCIPTADVFDKYSVPKSILRAFWENNTLTDFDFAVVIPSELQGTDLTEYVKTLIKGLKPSDSKALIFFKTSDTTIAVKYDADPVLQYDTTPPGHYDIIASNYVIEG